MYSKFCTRMRQAVHRTWGIALCSSRRDETHPARHRTSDTAPFRPPGRERGDVLPHSDNRYIHLRRWSSGGHACSCRNAGIEAPRWFPESAPVLHFVAALSAAYRSFLTLSPPGRRSARYLSWPPAPAFPFLPPLSFAFSGSSPGWSAKSQGSVPATSCSPLLTGIR